LKLFGAGVLGDSFGSLRDGVFGELTRKEKSDGSLDLTGCDGGSLVVVSKTAGFGGNPLEQVVDERVHDAHGLGRDASVGVNLLQHLVDIDGVGLLSSQLFLLLVATFADSFSGFARFLDSFTGNFRRHSVTMTSNRTGRLKQ